MSTLILICLNSSPLDNNPPSKNSSMEFPPDIFLKISVKLEKGNVFLRVIDKD